jgi:membrane-associated PAP2 superfamily phosphatase
MLGLGFGFLLGWVQQMRGAHFLFHTLWSMWISSLIILVMLQIFKTLITSDESKII